MAVRLSGFFILLLCFVVVFRDGMVTIFHLHRYLTNPRCASPGLGFPLLLTGLPQLLTHCGSGSHAAYSWLQRSASLWAQGWGIWKGEEEKFPFYFLLLLWMDIPLYKPPPVSESRTASGLWLPHFNPIYLQHTLDQFLTPKKTSVILILRWNVSWSSFTELYLMVQTVY